MQIEIKNQVYDLYFGLDALDYLNRVYTLTSEESGTTNLNPIIGQGLNFMYTGLESGNPVAVGNFIKAGTNTLKSKPSNRDIDDFIGGHILEDTLSDFIQEIMDFLKECPLTRRAVSKGEGVEDKKTKTRKKPATSD